MCVWLCRAMERYCPAGCAQLLGPALLLGGPDVYVSICMPAHLSTYLPPPSTLLQHVALSPDGWKVAVAMSSAAVCVFDVEDRQAGNPWEVSAAARLPACAAVPCCVALPACLGLPLGAARPQAICSYWHVPHLPDAFPSVLPALPMPCHARSSTAQTSQAWSSLQTAQS